MVEAYWLVAERDRSIVIRKCVGIYSSAVGLGGFDSVMVEYWYKAWKTR